MEHMEPQKQRYMQAASALNLFALGDAAGVVYWKPAGYRLYDSLKKLSGDAHAKRGYQEIKSPCLAPVELFKRSGHFDKYSEAMMFVDDSEAALRPMSCPNHILVYRSERRSYRQLPFKLFEFGEVFRNESSGSLQILFRQRQFCQDDSHVFVEPEKMMESVLEYLQMASEAYSSLGFSDISHSVSLRPEKRFGSDGDWDKAEEACREACRRFGVAFEERRGEGAFYGPKIEIGAKDKLGRSWQLGVAQLDYVLPKRFDLSYVGPNGKEASPAIIHHAVLGSIERMVGMLLEIHGVDLPEGLHPYPAAVVSVSEKSFEYAKIASIELGAALDSSDLPLGKKLENWRAKGCPSIYVVGESEASEYLSSGRMFAVLNRGKDRERKLISEKK